MHNEIQISMRIWRSPMSATSQGAFVVIPEISPSNISHIIKISVGVFVGNTLTSLQIPLRGIQSHT